MVRVTPVAIITAFVPSNGKVIKKIPVNPDRIANKKITHQYTKPNRFASIEVCSLNTLSVQITIPIITEKNANALFTQAIMTIPTVIDNTPSAKSNWNASLYGSWVKYPINLNMPEMIKTVPIIIHTTFAEICGNRIINIPRDTNAVDKVTAMIFARFNASMFYTPLLYCIIEKNIGLCNRQIKNSA